MILPRILKNWRLAPPSDASAAADDPACPCRPHQTSLPGSASRSLAPASPALLQIDDLIQTRAEQILFASLPSLLWLHCEFLRSTRVESRESQLQIRGNRQTEFARKPAATPHKLANPITSSYPINQSAQWLRNSSRPTKYASVERGRLKWRVPPDALDDEAKLAAAPAMGGLEFGHHQRVVNRLQQGQRYAASTSSEARKTRTLRPSKSSRIATRSRSSMPS